MGATERGADDGGGAPALLVCALLAAAVLATFLPPRGPLGEGAGELSAQRAAAHLSVVAAEPRPTGSAANERVRAYLLSELEAAGLAPETRAYDVGEVRVVNVSAVLPGSGEPGTVALVCHYDSRPETPGAGDDGAAVAALLEVARVLAEGPPLLRDVLFLFTDGEELDLLGARAFAERSPRAAEVALVLNFDAIGNAGPPVVFETGRGNGRVVAELASAVTRATGSSLGGPVYRRMPNDTDFSVFRDRGLPGLNFALCCGSTAYHQPGDTVERLSRSSLAQVGATALELARHFGDAPALPSEADAARGDRVFFSLPGGLLVHYPERWALPLAGLGSALAAAAALALARRERWRAGELARSALRLAALALGGALVVGGGVSALDGLGAGAAGLVLGAHPSGGNAPSGTLAFLALAWGVLLIPRVVARSRRAAEQTAALGVGVVACFSLIFARPDPGASYVLTGPVLGGAWALLAARFRTQGVASSLVALLPLALACAPGLHLVYMIASRARVEATVGTALALALLAAPTAAAVGGRTRGSRLAAGLAAAAALAAGVARAAGY